MSGEVQLPFESRAGRQQLALRSLRPIGSVPNLFLAVPGGPGISGRYLDDLLSTLELGPAWNVAIIDLPGHGLSRFTPEREPTQYPQLVQIISDVICALGSEHRKTLALGQSLGGRILLDSIEASAAYLAGAILTSAPVRFESSVRFQGRLAELQIDFGTAKTESEAANLWRKMIPLYFNRKPSEGEVGILSKDTCFLTTLGMLEGAQAARPSDVSRRFPLLFIEGAEDSVVPDSNTEELRTLFPTARFLRLGETGHFPMLEAPNEVRAAIASFVASIEGGAT